jgi:hypothetical protein
MAQIKVMLIEDDFYSRYAFYSTYRFAFPFQYGIIQRGADWAVVCCSSPWRNLRVIRGSLTYDDE